MRIFLMIAVCIGISGSIFAQSVNNNTGKTGGDYEKMVKEVKSETNLLRKEILFNTILKDFPGRNPPYVAYQLAREFAEKGDAEKMMRYYDLTTEPQRAVYKFLLATELSKSNPKSAEPILEQLVDSALKAMSSSDTSGNKATDLSPEMIYFSAGVPYVETLVRNGKAEKGYRFSREMMAKSNREDAAIEGAYLSTLLATNRLKEAFPLIVKIIKKGTATAEVRGKLKAAYIAEHGSDKDFLAFANGLGDQRSQYIQDAIAKEKKEYAAPDFSLEDVNGQTVSLTALRGKVVVLDFWATWCGPCKRSFPAMQRVVNKYKDDPEVVLLFIHTSENEPNPTAAAKRYIEDNKFTFRVLMDLRDAQGVSNVGRSFNVNGIPSKIIIDGKGMVRYQTAGANSNDDVAVDELSAMIESARNSGVSKAGL